MRVKTRVTPPIAPGNQQQGRSGKAGANGSSQNTTLEKLRRFAATQKSKRAGKYKRSAGVAEDEEEMSDFDSALVGAYERLHVDADAQGQGKPDQQSEQDNPDKSEKEQQALPKFLPAHARRI